MEEKLNQLPLNKRKAVELKYAGKKQAEIAEECNVSPDTVYSWFKEGGELFELLSYYTQTMNEKRQENIDEAIKISAQEWGIVRKNLFSKVAKALQDPEFEPKNFSELSTALDKLWFWGRVEANLPTNYDKTLIEEPESTIDEQQMVKELGLDVDDFLPENYERTLAKIVHYKFSRRTQT